MTKAGATAAPAPGRRVWVTRAQPGAAATAERLRALNFDPLVLPLLEVRPVKDSHLDLTGVGALAFTSANGVAAFAARSPVRDLPAFAVGAATARAAWGAGFAHVISAEGDVGALALVIHSAGEFPGAVLHAAPAEPAGDLAGALAGFGVAARAVTLYETAPADLAEAHLAEAAAADIVLLHSPKAARVLAAYLETHPAPALKALCLSPAVAAPLGGVPLRSVTAAVAPSEPALLALLPGVAAA